MVANRTVMKTKHTPANDSHYLSNYNKFQISTSKHQQSHQLINSHSQIGICVTYHLDFDKVCRKHAEEVDKVKTVFSK